MIRCSLKDQQNVVEEKPVVGLGNSWPLSLAAPGENETLEENFPFGVTVVVFVASAEATEPLKGFPVLSPLPETHPRIRTRGTNFIRFGTRSDRPIVTSPGWTRIRERRASFKPS